MAFGRVVQGLLFEVAPIDPTTLASVAAVMFIAAGSACYFPAQRATRVDPMVVLKSD